MAASTASIIGKGTELLSRKFIGRPQTEATVDVIEGLLTPAS